MRPSRPRGGRVARQANKIVLVPVPAPVERHTLQIAAEFIRLGPRVDDSRLAREPQWFGRAVQPQGISIQRVLEHGKPPTAAPFMRVRELPCLGLDQCFHLIGGEKFYQSALLYDDAPPSFGRTHDGRPPLASDEAELSPRAIIGRRDVD